MLFMSCEILGESRVSISFSVMKGLDQTTF